MPHIFYRVFRHGTFGQLAMELVLPTEKDAIYSVKETHGKAEALAHLNKYYPQGLSPHGQQYLFDGYHHTQDREGNTYTGHIPVMELAFELYRLGHFPDKPSRFTSFYACETLADALHFRANICHGRGIIHRVSCEHYYRADMNYLYLGAGMPSFFVYAERYWLGEASPQPFWEILMQGPVTILEQVG